MNARIIVTFDIVFEPGKDTRSEVTFKAPGHTEEIPDSVKGLILEEIALLCEAGKTVMK